MQDQNTQREMTKEEAADLEVRVKSFNGDLIPLLKKWELGLGASAFLLPDGRIAARPQVFSDRKLDSGAGGAPVVSPVPAPAPAGGISEA